MKIEDVEGIGPDYAAKLASVGVGTTDSLLSRGATAKGRGELAGATGISAERLLEWVNRADLGRLKGVGSEYSDLLEAAGVDSPPELAQRNAANLSAAMATYNETHQIVRRVPTEAEVAGSITEAKTLPRIVEH